MEDSVPIRPGRNGGVLRSGNPGNKGGGRKSKAIRRAEIAMFELALGRPEVARAIQRVLANENHPSWARAIELCADRIWGKPRQAVAVTGGTQASWSFPWDSTDDANHRAPNDPDTTTDSIEETDADVEAAE